MFKNWAETILKDYPRLAPDSKFTFSCHEGLPCFTKCCADVNIFLTPYDVLRMKKALHITSAEFLQKYTLPPVVAGQKLPLVLLRMKADQHKSCPFVTPTGCRIYEDRPWACRMFPLGIASSKTTDRPEGVEFCFMVEDGLSCAGFKERKEWTVGDWWKDQGIDLYDKKCEPYKEITLHRFLREGKALGPAKMQMFYLTCYDTDRFRRLVFESSFFSRFLVSAENMEAIRTDDEALLDFGYKWLRFSLFGERTLRIRREALQKAKSALPRPKKTRAAS